MDREESAQSARKGQKGGAEGLIEGISRFGGRAPGRKLTRRRSKRRPSRRIVFHAEQELRNLLDTDPSDQKLADYLGLELDELQALLTEAPPQSSTQAGQRGAKADSYPAFESNLNEILDLYANKQALNAVMAMVSEIDRDVALFVCLRFVESCKVEEIMLCVDWSLEHYFEVRRRLEDLLLDCARDLLQ